MPPASLSAAPVRWPRAIGGVDELCIAPDADTRFYVFGLTGRAFLGLPQCDPTHSNDKFSATFEPLFDTTEGLADP